MLASSHVYELDHAVIDVVVHHWDHLHHLLRVTLAHLVSLKVIATIVLLSGR